MKKNKKPIIALLVVAIIGVIGFTLAYFSDKININNIFKTKPYGTTVTEVFTSPDNWTPGTTIDKTVVAKNTGEVDVAVRVSYTEEWKANDGTILSGWVDKDGNVTDHEDELETDERAAIINFVNTRDWTEQNGYYYYNYKLAKNEESSSFIKSVTFNSLVQSDSNCEETNENGTKTVTCSSTKKGYDGATYTLNIKVETVQYDQYKSAWNTDVAIATDKNNLLYDVVESKGVKYTGNGSDTYANDVYFLGDNDKNNVVFANKCWKIVRTTETGGIKLLYNGEPTDDKCDNSGEETTIGESAFNESAKSPAYVGYMYNTVFEDKWENNITGPLYGNDVSYENGMYTLKATSNVLDENHHYSCNNTTGECENVRYYYGIGGIAYSYIELSETKNIETALEEMLHADDVNEKDSTI